MSYKFNLMLMHYDLCNFFFFYVNLHAKTESTKKNQN